MNMHKNILNIMGYSLCRWDVEVRSSSFHQHLKSMIINDLDSELLLALGDLMHNLSADKVMRGKFKRCIVVRTYHASVLVCCW